MQTIKNRIHLLGPVLIQHKGQIIKTLGSRKGLALLVYLSQQPEPVNRAYLADLLWPDLPEKRGRRNLSRELSQLTGLFGDCFQTDYHTIQFVPTAAVWLDTAMVSHLYEEGQLAGSKPDPNKLVEAVSLYRGSFMDGFMLDGCPDFEVWLIRQQEKWQQLVAGTLTWLADYYAQHKEFEQAEIFLRHWLTIQPWQEQAHLQLMALLAGSGRPGTALAQYEICCRILAEELDVAPSAQLVALYEQIQAERLSEDEIPLPFDPRSTEPPPPCPYQGLVAFTQAEADFFFGREALVEHLVEMMQQKSLVAVVGPSGSGKSSVVLAGLLAHLGQNPASAESSLLERPEQWLPVVMRPGSEPGRRLTDALQALLAPSGTDTPAPQTTADPPVAPAFLLISDILKQTSVATRPLLVIDQFEELYTLCSSPERRQEFLDTLLSLANLTQSVPSAHPPQNGTAFHPAQNGTAARTRPLITIIITLRADFMGQALAYRPLADALQNADIKLGPMNTAELRRAIIQPAARQGLALEAGLVERLLNDVGQEPGYLPLLEFTLTVLWSRQQAGQLTTAAYEAVGGVYGALTRYADNVYAELNPDQQHEAKHIFMQLVSPGEGTEDTRRRANLDDLSETGRQVVEILVGARLLVTNRAANAPETVEIAHEALIRGWEQLQVWLSQNRTFLLWQEQLRHALHRWESSNYDDDDSLLRGAWLAEAEKWLENRPHDLIPTEQSFIAAGIAQRDRQAQAVEAQRQRELAQALALAQAQHRRAEIQTRASRRLRWLAVGLAAVLTVAVILGLLTWQAQQQAEESATVAQSLSLSASAQLVLSQNNTDLALALALEANRLDNPPPQARLMLAETAYTSGARRAFTGHSGPVQGVAISPNGHTALSASADETLRLWDLETGETLRIFSGHSGPVQGVAISPNGQTTLSASADETLILFDIESGETLHVFNGHTAAVNSVAISPDGKTALSGSADETLRLWNIETGETLRVFNGHTAAVNSVAISPDGRTAMSGSANGDVFLWDINSGRISYRLAGIQSTVSSVVAEQGHAGPVLSLLFSADGLIAFSGSIDELITRWDLSGSEISLQRFRVQPPSGVFSLALSPDGRTLLSGLLDSRITSLNATTNQTSRQFLGHTGRVLALAFQPDGQMALSGAADGSLRLWNLEHGALLRHLFADASTVSGFINLSAASMALGPDGQLGATGHWNGDISLWDYQTGEVIRTLTGHTNMVFGGVLFSPDGKTLISGSGDIFAQSTDNTIRLWDIAAGQELQRLEGHTDKLWDIDVSADSRFVVSGSHDGTLRRWDLQTGQGQILLDVFPQAVRSVAFSPDGTLILAGLGKGASSTPNYDLRLIDGASGQELRRFAGHQELVSDVVFDPTGEMALSGAGDTTLILWNVATGEEIRRFTGHTGTVLAVTFSPDGSLVASASQNKTAIIWDAATGSQLRRFPDHGGSVVDLAFTPEVHTLLTAAAEDGLHEWRIDQDQTALLDWIAANRYISELTCQQREQYNITPLCEATP